MIAECILIFMTILIYSKLTSIEEELKIIRKKGVDTFINTSWIKSCLRQRVVSIWK